MIVRGDGMVVIDDGVVEVIEEFSYSVVEYILQVEEELTEFVWDLSRIVPPDDMVNWATIIVVSRTDHLRGEEMK